MRDFFRIPNAVIDSGLNAFAISVYAVLARHVGRNENCWPSLSRIQKLTKLSRHTVIRAIDDLRLAGMLEIGRGPGRANRYVLTSAPGAPVDDRTSARGAPTSARGAPVPVHVVHPNKTYRKRLIKKIDECADANPKSKATRIPVDFQVTEAHREWAQEEGLASPDLHVEAFRDYWLAKAGKDGLKADWDAAFRTWMRHEKKWNGGNNERAAIPARTRQNSEALRGFRDHEAGQDRQSGDRNR